MEDTRKLIEQNLSKYPEMEYYLPLIEKAKSNLKVHPDICIETCKSLLEGISKTIIKRLDNDYKDTTKKLKSMDMSVLIKKSMKLLSENDDEFKIDFTRASASLAYSLGTLRNARGDISHGKSAPKEIESTVSLSSAVLKITDGLLVYMLLSYFKRRSDQNEVIEYDENQDFNDYLDELNPLEGKPLYSRALYDQYYEDYEINLNSYIEQRDEDVL